MEKMVSPFAVTNRAKKSAKDAPTADGGGGASAADDPRMEAAMDAMEREFAGVDENDPRAMARMMRRMSELTGEKIDGQMEEIVRKLEEGADPESLEDELGGTDDGARDEAEDTGGAEGGPSAEAAKQEGRFRFKIRRRPPARRDPKLYDYDED
jgi:hypothetical protein